MPFIKPWSNNWSFRHPPHWSWFLQDLRIQHPKGALRSYVIIDDHLMNVDVKHSWKTASRWRSCHLSSRQAWAIFANWRSWTNPWQQWEDRQKRILRNFEATRSISRLRDRRKCDDFKNICGCIDEEMEWSVIRRKACDHPSQREWTMMKLETMPCQRLTTSCSAAKCVSCRRNRWWLAREISRELWFKMKEEIGKNFTNYS